MKPGDEVLVKILHQGRGIYIYRVGIFVGSYDDFAEVRYVGEGGVWRQRGTLLKHVYPMTELGKVLYL